MDELQIGDAVKVADGTYSKMYSFSHKQVSANGTYLQIQTGTMGEKHTLEITANHLLYAFVDESLANTKLILAQDIQVGDLLVTAEAGRPSRVLSIGTVEGNFGLYTPITVSGDILVNGVLASCYTSVDCLDGFVSSEQVLHWLSHGTMAPYRLYCAVKGGCQDESYNEKEGLNPWIGFLSSVQDALLLDYYDTVGLMMVKALIVLASAVPVLFFTVLGHQLLTISTATTMLLQITAVLAYYHARCKSHNPAPCKK